jgi:5-methylcytosine-specific restriction endonuclease McrA
MIREQVWLKVFRQDSWAEQGGKCAYCTVKIPAKKVTGDHVIPRSQGGTTTRANIKAACHDCNRAKRSLSEKQFNKKIRGPQRGDHISIWMAWASRRIAVRTQQACDRIEKMVS